MKLLFLTGSRGEWGYIRPILRLCQRRDVDYNICATNMHLLDSFGLTVEEIRREGFEVSDELFMTLDGYNHFTMVKSMGCLLSSFVDVLYRLKPDWLVLAGDRGEQLAGAIAGSYTYTPVVHIQAGERSGNIDGLARHAIGKLVHLHFAANKDAADRLVRLGEEAFRVHTVGAPQLDELREGLYTGTEALKEKHDFPFDRPFLLVVQHPVTEEFLASDSQVQAVLGAVSRFDMPKIWILPNSDAGSETIRRHIVEGRHADTHLYTSLQRQDYLGIMKAAACMVGNSSSALLEAPTFGVPAVNLGRRQADRVRAANVIDIAAFDADTIESGIRQACSPEFRRELEGLENPYGDGRSAERILDVLESTPRDDRLLIKQMTY